VEIELFQDGGQIKNKKNITMGAKIQAFDIFQTPLSSHYPLPLRWLWKVKLVRLVDWKVRMISYGEDGYECKNYYGE
jgi:hypothetical protein